MASYYVGIDWAKETHAIAVVSKDGEVLRDFTVTNDGLGFSLFFGSLLKLGGPSKVVVGIETAHSIFVDQIRDAGYRVYAIHPNQITHARNRHSNSGAKSDQLDARVIADYLRTDARRITLFEPDSEETRALRSLRNSRRALVADKTRITHRLSAVLERHFPAALNLFSSLDCGITRAFLKLFPSQEQGDKLNLDALRSFLKENRYPGKAKAEVLMSRFLEAPRGSIGAEARSTSITVNQLVSLLDATIVAIKETDEAIEGQLGEHPDQEIFRSLPMTATTMATSLLTLFGDRRDRYKNADQLAAICGVVPVNKQSGKYSYTHFRHACRKEDRYTLHLFSNLSRRKSVWAQDIYERARARGKKHPHALRILSRAWLRIIFACWKNRTPYDPTIHKGAQGVEA